MGHNIFEINVLSCFFNAICLSVEMYLDKRMRSSFYLLPFQDCCSAIVWGQYGLLKFLDRSADERLSSTTVEDGLCEMLVKNV